VKWLLVVACACTRPPANEPLQNAAPSLLVAIENVPTLAIERVRDAKRDCRPSHVIRKRFAGRQVIACGALTLKASKPELAAAKACTERALADEQPFLVEAEQMGTDSIVTRTLLGIVEKGVLETYLVDFDSDPCGGSCPNGGLTTVERCGRMRADVSNPEACAIDVTRCFRCETQKRVEICRFGD
jgi:hypothetical protein